MNKLHLIMPMAGKGSRFFENGFVVPKPLIEIKGKPFFFWAVRSVEKFVECAEIVFVILEEHIRENHLDDAIHNYWPNARIIALSKVTEGAAITALRAVETIPENEPLLINDCDHLFYCKAFNDFVESEDIDNGPAAALLTFQSDNPAFSYVQYDVNNNVCGTVEKQVVSQDAICGAYYFRNRQTYISACKAYLLKCAYKEYFISGIYNSLIEQQASLGSFRTDFHLPFGTPDEYYRAEQDDNNTRFCFLDKE